VAAPAGAEGLDAGYWMLDTGYWIGFWILESGYWILVVSG